MKRTEILLIDTQGSAQFWQCAHLRVWVARDRKLHNLLDAVRASVELLRQRMHRIATEAVALCGRVKLGLVGIRLVR